MGLQVLVNRSQRQMLAGNNWWRVHLFFVFAVSIAPLMQRV
jgi:hypothetical protein